MTFEDYLAHSLSTKERDFYRLEKAVEMVSKAFSMLDSIEDDDFFKEVEQYHIDLDRLSMHMHSTEDTEMAIMAKDMMDV